MPKISSKGLDMPEPPIRKLVPFAEKAEENGKEVFYLNIGQPDIPTPQIALDAVKNNNLTTLAYTHSAGNESLRDKLAKYYQKLNLSVSKKDIIVTTGGSEALIFSMGSITNPGDEIIVPEPFYANYYSFSTQLAVTVVPVISKIENDFALPPISNFEDLITKRTKAILICNPGNPTGYLYSKEEIQQLTELALKYDLFIISDEVYREFVYDDNAKHYSILQEEKLKEHAIVVDSVSKRYSMCGARIGCIASRNSEVIETAMKFAQARLSPPTYAQIASEAALGVPDKYYNEVITEYKSRRDTLVECLKLIPNIKISIPRGAFYCMVELPIHNSEHFAQWMLENFSDNNQTIMVAPALGFYSSINAGRNQIRIAYVLKKEDLIRSTEILGLGLNAYLNNQ